MLLLSWTAKKKKEKNISFFSELCKRESKEWAAENILTREEKKKKRQKGFWCDTEPV